MSRYGVSPVITILLLIIITISAGIMLYLFVFGWGSSATKTTNTLGGVLSYDFHEVDFFNNYIRVGLRNLGSNNILVDTAYIGDSNDKLYEAHIGQIIDIKIIYKNLNGERVQSVTLHQTTGINPGYNSITLDISYNSDNNGLDTEIIINIIFHSEGALSGTLLTNKITLTDTSTFGTLSNIVASGNLGGYGKNGKIDSQTISIRTIDMYTDMGEGYTYYENISIPSSDMIVIDIHPKNTILNFLEKYYVKIISTNGITLYIPPK
jgi:flagellin-like protein